MIKVVFLVLLAILFVPTVANGEEYAVNSLQDTVLKAQNAIMTLEFDFGQDEIKEMRTKTVFNPVLNSLKMTLLGDVIDLSDSRLKVYSNGKLFSVLNTELGIVMYGKYQEELDNYRINVYFAADNGLRKQVVTTEFKLPDDKIIKPTETKPAETKPQYVPDLKMTSSHDFRTYWQDTFNIDVQAFDGRINPNPKQSDFSGRIDGVDVKVMLSLDDIPVATLSGVTANNGHWAGEYFFKDNLSKPDEYAVDVILSYLGKTVSKSSTMFIIGTTTGGGTSNHPPVANAGADDTTANGVPISLDGTGSSDPDGDTITYSWVKLSGPAGTFVDTDTSTPDYTPSATGTAVFELTVTDSRGKSNTDSVTIIVS